MTTFCVGAGENPSTASACTASSTTAEDIATPPSADVLAPLDEPMKGVILSFNSTMIRCAALGPMPFTLLSERTSSVCTIFAKSAGVNADRIMRAVCPPMPDTLSKTWKRSRSIFVANPKSR